jgi:hypothetical protein
MDTLLRVSQMFCMSDIYSLWNNIAILFLLSHLFFITNLFLEMNKYMFVINCTNYTKQILCSWGRLTHLPEPRLAALALAGTPAQAP